MNMTTESSMFNLVLIFVSTFLFEHFPILRIKDFINTLRFLSFIYDSSSWHHNSLLLYMLCTPVFSSSGSLADLLHPPYLRNAVVIWSMCLCLYIVPIKQIHHSYTSKYPCKLTKLSYFGSKFSGGRFSKKCESFHTVRFKKPSTITSVFRCRQQ